MVRQNDSCDFLDQKCLYYNKVFADCEYCLLAQILLELRNGRKKRTKG